MLTGNYTYSDLNGNPESGSTYQWYRADALAGPYTVIAGATDSAYVLTTSDETKYIKFEVTPITATAPTTGTPVEATPVGPVGADSYYAGANLLTGDPLKSAFHNIIKGHTEFSYDELWSHLSYTDEDVSNTDNVILIHTGWSIPKTSMATGDDANNDAYWNREHVWAKYHGDFGTDTGPGTDLHHLRPSDRSVNSARGNLYFDDGGTAYVDDSAATGCFKNGSTSWEPRDAVKGDIARMIFYMAARYEGEAATDHSYDLELETGTSGGADPYHGNMETLLEWHEADPVDLTEYRRNERIFELQGNRNPFIDYPDTVSKIWFTLPELDGAVAESSTTVKITFSKAVDETIAETIGNYGIDGGLMVFSAVLDANNVDLVLTTSAQTLSQAYTITVNNVEDTDNHVITANSTVDFTGFNPGNTYVNLTNYTLVMAGNDSKEVVVNCGAVDPYGEGGGMFLNGSFVVMVRGGASYNTFDEWDTVITAKDFDLSIRNRVYYVNATHPNYSGESDDGAVIRLSGTPVDSFIVGDVNSFGEFKSEHRTRIDIDEFSDNQSTGEFFDVTTSPADMTGYTHPVYIWEMADSNTTDLPTYETSYVIFYIP
ncbi:MAG: hypothetical protein GY754_37080 [bacterium]|nr:hypothetical protein [bacterium]